jgi:hypothetical protein
MGSGGKGIFKQAEQGIRDTGRKWRNDPMGEFINLAANVYSAGYVGYKDGGFKEGRVIHGIDEGVGEISGRNKARIAGYEAEKDIREAEQNARLQQEKEQMARYRADLAASRGAEGIRNTAAARERATSRSQPLGAEEQDILGA